MFAKGKEGGFHDFPRRFTSQFVMLATNSFRFSHWLSIYSPFLLESMREPNKAKTKATRDCFRQLFENHSLSVDFNPVCSFQANESSRLPAELGG